MKKQIKEIIEWTLNRMDMYSDDAAAMIYRTGMAETGYKHLKQMGGGPAIGFFQIEPATIDNYVAYRPQIKTDLYALGFDEKDGEMRVMSNIALQVAFCRLCYRRDKNAIPSLENMKAQAKYWKKVYNTKLGKGTVEHFMEMNHG